MTFFSGNLKQDINQFWKTYAYMRKVSQSTKRQKGWRGNFLVGRQNLNYLLICSFKKHLLSWDFFFFNFWYMCQFKDYSNSSSHVPPGLLTGISKLNITVKIWTFRICWHKIWYKKKKQRIIAIYVSLIFLFVPKQKT